MTEIWIQMNHVLHSRISEHCQQSLRIVQMKKGSMNHRSLNFSNTVQTKFKAIKSRLNNNFLDLQDTISAFKMPYTILIEIPAGSTCKSIHILFINNQPNKIKRKQKREEI